jgi:hypothetical protein
VLESCKNEAFGWYQLYDNNPNFDMTYQMLGMGMVISNFHVQYGILFHLRHLCISSTERVKMIWEAHCSWVTRHFGMQKIVAVLQKYFYWMKL